MIYTDINSLKAWAKDKKIVGFDTETTGLDPFVDDLVCIQLGDEEHQFVIDTRNLDLWESGLKEILESKILVGVNLNFDLKFLLKHQVKPLRVIDLYLQEINLHNGYYTPTEFKGKGSLLGLAMSYLGVELSKAMQTATVGKPKDEPMYMEEIQYAADDVKYLLPIFNLQYAEVKKKDLVEVCRLENNFTVALSQMEFTGIYTDPDMWEEISIEVNSSMARVKDDITALFHTLGMENKRIPGLGVILTGYETNAGHRSHLSVSFSSPKQMLSLSNFFLPEGSKIESTNKEAMEEVQDMHDFFPLYMEYRSYYSLMSKFSDKIREFIHPATGRIHTRYGQIKETGRMSSSKPNLQQIPSKGPLAMKMRAAFKSEHEDDVIITADYSNFELRIIAEGSQDPLWLKIFNEGGDLHSTIASEVFDCPIEDVKTESLNGVSYRNIAKTINFGLAYGMSAVKLAQTIKVPEEEAERIIELYFSKVPAVRRFLTYLGDSSRKGYSKTFKPVSRKRFYNLEKAKNKRGKMDNKLMGSYERKSKNHPIQGTNADIVKDALSTLDKFIYLNNLPAEILLTVHDEIVVAVRNDMQEYMTDKVVQIMKTCAEKVIKSVPVVVDPMVTTHWTK